eukprot:CAMPEP_0201116120 /NCGR_PEP_ID=MMETSP0850-20130426/489_1 /ASSEMBLY_ACC=CAM_ASM_000622 /TAXON_ID=183588 /ORGANISM="Pseudo-nitzschia fraudulenta, Strain WWA7" /LENGTH=269 /DNA_ID=CAMNT_0047380123 /DNA_START=205 /DNA_END=1015 /DNA_ORIENTATION=+
MNESINPSKRTKTTHGVAWRGVAWWMGVGSVRVPLAKDFHRPAATGPSPAPIALRAALSAAMGDPVVVVIGHDPLSHQPVHGGVRIQTQGGPEERPGVPHQEARDAGHRVGEPGREYPPLPERQGAVDAAGVKGDRDGGEQIDEAFHDPQAALSHELVELLPDLVVGDFRLDLAEVARDQVDEERHEEDGGEPEGDRCGVDRQDGAAHVAANAAERVAGIPAAAAVAEKTLSSPGVAAMEKETGAPVADAVADAVVGVDVAAWPLPVGL